MNEIMTRVVELEDHSSNSLTKQAALSGWQQSFFDYSRILFVLIVLLPGFAVTGYYAIVASDVFVSESKFVVRSSSGSSSLGLQGVGESMGIGENSDTSIVNTFLVSADALSNLRQNTAFDTQYGHLNIDPLSRFPGVFWKDNNEARLEYYQSLLDVYFDKTTQITTLSVRAFEPGAAQSMSRHLLKASEDLVNRLTFRMRQDMISKAERDVLVTEQEMLSLQKSLERWRQDKKMIDPVSYSKGISEVIARLALELSGLRASMQEMKVSAPNNPQVRQGKFRIQALKDQIDLEWKKLAGGDNSIATGLSEYEQLIVEYKVAQKIYGMAKAGLVSARSEANQRESYLVTVTEPQLPTYPRFPKRVLKIFTWWVGLFFLYLIISKVVRNIVRHGVVRRHTTLGNSLTVK